MLFCIEKEVNVKLNLFWKVAKVKIEFQIDAHIVKNACNVLL
jgi:hypothetical protein